MRVLRTFRLLELGVPVALVWLILHYRGTRAAAKQELLRVSEDVDRLRDECGARMAKFTHRIDDLGGRSPAPDRAHQEHADGDADGGMNNPSIRLW